MKLGVFLPNGQNGYVVSKASPQYVPTFAHMLAITKESEAIGLDFILSMIKYRGFGGETGYWVPASIPSASPTRSPRRRSGSSFTRLFPYWAFIQPSPRA